MPLFRYGILYTDSAIGKIRADTEAEARAMIEAATNDGFDHPAEAFDTFSAGNGATTIVIGLEAEEGSEEDGSAHT